MTDTIEDCHDPWDCGVHHTRYAEMANGGTSPFCCACSWGAMDYMWPCAGSQ